MITYELAKKLKDAGLTQKTDPVSKYLISHSDKFFYFGLDGGLPSDNIVYIPSLSELIEACGDRFHCLVHEMTGGIDGDKEFWSAGITRDVTDWQNGSTPEEAVANLYIALKNK